jgi:hypothetical protein
VTPALSIVLPIRTAEQGRAFLASIRKSTLRANTELVVVCESRATLGLDEEAVAAGLAGLRIVELGPFRALADARAAGIEAANAPLVFVAETHAFPEKGCLEALVAAHGRGDYAAVAPVFETTDAHNPWAWANFFLSYGYMLEPVEAAAEVPCYNCCFRRQALLELGDDLPRALASGSLITRDLEARGYAVHREATARIRHQNVGRLGSTIADRVYATRAWAAARAAGWSPVRRALALAATPLVPPLLVWRTVRSPQWRHVRAELPRGTKLALLYAASWVAVGEALAYAAGPGDAAQKVIPIELERWRHV